MKFNGESARWNTDFGRIKLVGKISLWLSFISISSLLVMYFFVAPPGENYRQYIYTLSVSQRDLPVVMLVTGLILTLITSVITWLVSLYSSFRIAGPLYRFSRNVEAWLNYGRRDTIPLRKEDTLQQESRLMEESIKEYRHYLDGFQPLLVQAQQAMDEGDSKQLNHCLELLMDMAGKARIEHDSAR